jgi:hypothetical protein
VSLRARGAAFYSRTKDVYLLEVGVSRRYVCLCDLIKRVFGPLHPFPRRLRVQHLLPPNISTSTGTSCQLLTREESRLFSSSKKNSVATCQQVSL